MHAGVSVGLRDIESCPAKASNYAQIRRWLQECKRNHSMCSLESIQRLIGSSSMPKRLIDLGYSTDLSTKPPIAPKIVYPRRQEQYATLSYRWGLEPYLQTTSTNLCKLEDVIPLDQVPQTIKDAFVVAVNLGVRYVWIDALCIIQDDAADWEAEARRMGVIYANSYFTIAATNASHAGEGFLNARLPGRVAIPFCSGSEQEACGEVYFRQPTDFLRDYFDYILESPLLERAWVLQETLLSRRTLHFTSKQIYMECRCAMFAEDGNTLDASERTTSAHSFLNLLTVSNIGSPGKLTEMFFRQWRETLEQYTTLSITRPSDRLPALAGLASLAERTLGCQYLYGIWNFHLPYGLFWQPADPPMVSATEWRAPSWSWAAWEGGVLFLKFFPEQDSRIQLLKVVDGNALGDGLLVRGRILPCHVSLDLRPQPQPCRSDRKLGRIPITPPEYAFAEDESTLLAHLAAPDHEPPNPSEETQKIQVSQLRLSGGRLMSAQSPTERNICRFDGERGAETGFYFFVLACAESIGFHHCQGLILRRLKGQTEMYQRVGTGWATDEAWHTCPESVITLV